MNDDMEPLTPYEREDAARYEFSMDDNDKVNLMTLSLIEEASKAAERAYWRLMSVPAKAKDDYALHEDLAQALIALRRFEYLIGTITTKLSKGL